MPPSIALPAIGLATGASTLAAGGAAAGIVGAGIGGYGAIESGEASSAAAKYQSQVSANNAQIATQNATYATAAGEAQVTQQQLKTAATIGGIRGAQAASGLDVNSGSNEDVQSSAAELGELSVLNIRNAAAKQAYGYQTQSVSDVAQGQLSQAASGQDLIAGGVGATGSVIGGAASSANSYAKFLQGSGNAMPNVTGTATGGS